MPQERKDKAPRPDANDCEKQDKGQQFKGKRNRRGNGKPAPKEHAPWGNDVSWWIKIPALIKDAANVKSNYIAGSYLAENDIPYRVPGVAVVNYIPVYGNSKTATDPVNVWARDLYLQMFQKWRGISSYSAADLGIAIIASIEVARLIAKLERIYGVINRYSKLNLNMPQVEAAALGLNIADANAIRTHLSDYRYDLNELIRKAQRLCIPRDISLIADQVSLLGYEYLDHDNIKAQIIMYDSNLFGVFSDTLMQSGGSIKFTSGTMISGAPNNTSFVDMTASCCFPFLKTMLDALLGSTSIQRIYGDLITWFGQEQMLEFALVPEDYMVLPVFDETILHKTHNAMWIVGRTIDTVSSTNLSSTDINTLDAITNGNEYVIYQENDVIHTAISFSVGGSTPDHFLVGTDRYTGRTTNPNTYFPVSSPNLLDTYRVEVSDDVVIEGSLFKFILEPHQGVNSSGSAIYAAEVTSVCFELIRYVTLYTNEPTDVTFGTTSRNITCLNNTSNAAAEQAGYLAVLDWAPLVYHITGGKTLGVYGDVDTPIPMYTNTLSKLHRAIVYSGLHTELHVLDGRTDKR